MASYKDDILCSPLRSTALSRRSPSPERGRRIIVEDVVEPFGIQTSISGSTSYANSLNYNDRHIPNSQGHSVSRSSMHIPSTGASGYDETQTKLPYSSTSSHEITNRYSSNLESQNTATRYNMNGAYETSADLPHIGPLEKVDPYSIPLGEKENAPYRGPLVRTVTESYCRDLEKGSGYVYPGKVINTNPVSEERIEELSNRYKERMARTQQRQTKQHHNRSRSDNSIDRGGSVTTHRELCDNLIIKKYETAMLQIDKLEGNIKHLKLEVNTLQAAKNQGEMRVSVLNIIDVVDRFNGVFVYGVFTPLWCEYTLYSYTICILGLHVSLTI